MTREASEIPGRLRAQLLSMGIRGEDHQPHTLAKLFPAELNVAATAMTGEDLANVLIYLVTKKMIALPGDGGGLAGAAVKKVGPGWHFCQFYRSDDELLAMIAPYIAEGLRNEEGCFWVMPQTVSRDAARQAVARHIDDIDDYIGSGQLEMMSHPRWYLDDGAQLKSFEQIAQGLLARQDRALARGWKFLRAAGDTGWVSGTEQSRSFIDYEMKVNAALGATKVAAVCTYRADVTADELIAIVTAHQDALYQANAA